MSMKRLFLLAIAVLLGLMLTACGNTVNGLGDGDNGDPFADNPPRDVKVGTLTLHESRIYIDYEAGEYRLHMPVTLDPGSPLIRATAAITVADYAGTLNEAMAKSAEASLSVTSKEIVLPLGKDYLPAYDAAAGLLLNYKISFNQLELPGTVSFFYVMPRVQTQLLGAKRLLEGDTTLYKVFVQNRQAGDPIMNVPIKLTALLGEEQVASGTGKTDSFGQASIELSIPAELDGQLDLVATVDTELGQQVVRTTASCERFDKVLLTTDKPVYQPGQTIYIRALSLRVPHKTPLGAREVTLEILDPKGTKVFKEKGTTSEWGIFSTSFKLASLVGLGNYKVQAVIGTDNAVVEEKTILVDNYVLPKFNISFSSDKEFYLPGQAFTGTVNSQYFYGKPVAGGAVHVSAKKFDIEYAEFQTVDGTLDDKGEFSFDLTLPNYFTGSELEQGNAFVQFDITVTDTAGHEQTTVKKALVVQNPVLITLVPEAGRILPGLEQLFYLILNDPSGKPVGGVVNISSKAGNFDVTVPVLGIAVFPYTAAGDELDFTVKLGDITKVFSFTKEANAEFVMVAPLKPILEVGDTLPIAIVASYDPTDPVPALLPDRVYLDVIQNGQTRLMKTVELTKGKATVDISIDETLTGPVELMAYYLNEEGNIIRDARTVYVRKAANLAIDLATDKETYKPREKANLTFSVTDLAGDPAEAALGVSIVDEAVFAVQNFKPGLEQTYFELEENIMNPTYTVYGVAPSDIMGAEPATEEEQKELDERTNAYFAAEGDRAGHGLVEDSYKAPESTYKGQAATAVGTRIETVFSAYKDQSYLWDCTQYTLLTADDAAVLLASAVNADPWGNLMTGTFTQDTTIAKLVIVSNGPDEMAGTADDVTVTYKLCDPNGRWGGGEDDGNGDPNAGTDNATAADSGAEYSDADVPDSHEKDGVKTREWFPETLYVNPQLLTDAKGKALVELTMPDSITAWRVTTLANTMGGSLGSVLHAITVFQDFFVDIDFPVFLTQNDSVKVPVGIYNYLSEEQTVVLTASAEDWFEMVGDASVTVTVPANSVTAAYFPVKVLKIGQHTLTVTAQGSKMSDAIKRAVKVLPAGIPQNAVESDILSGDTVATLNIPAEAVDGSEELFVKIYPGMMSQVVEGLDSLFQMPCGCFEQTSSATYPNIMVLQYMLKTGTITPEIELKARDYILQGYQRLLTYEVQGGGFEWFGTPPAHFVLTTYGLMEFVDMAMVHEVDPAVIERTAAWMVTQQNGDGSFIPSTGGIAEGAIDNYQDSVFRTTAYAVWAFARADMQQTAREKGAEYLLAHLDEATDNYTKAIAAIALVSAGFEDEAAVGSFIDEIIADMQDDGKGGFFWEQALKTEFYSEGAGANIETTAIIGLLLLEYGGHNIEVQGVLNWLAGNKDSFGNWSTTQGTVLALRLMVEAQDKMTPDPADATITVSAGGTPVTFTVDETNSDVMRFIDLGTSVKKGVNTVTIGFSGTGQLMYSAVARWYVPGSAQTGNTGPLDITVTYDKTTLAVNDTVTATVDIENISAETQSVILANIGVPPGFDLIVDKLDTLLAQEGTFLQKYETTDRQIILYINQITAGQTVSLSYDLLARFPIEGNTGESSVNPYYAPEDKDQAEGQVLTVTE